MGRRKWNRFLTCSCSSNNYYNKPIQKAGRYFAIKVSACLVIIYEMNLSAKFSNTINILFSGDAIVEMLTRNLFHISTHFGYTQIVQ